MIYSKSLNKWIKDSLKKGYSFEQISEKLKKNNYPKKEIKKLLEDYQKKAYQLKTINKIKVFLIIVLVLISCFLILTSLLHRSKRINIYSRNELLSIFLEAHKAELEKTTEQKVKIHTISKQDLFNGISNADILLLYANDELNAVSNSLGLYTIENQINTADLSFFNKDIDKRYSVPFVRIQFVFVLKDQPGVELNDFNEVKDWVKKNPSNFKYCHPKNCFSSKILLTSIIHGKLNTKELDYNTVLNTTISDELFYWFEKTHTYQNSETDEFPKDNKIMKDLLTAEKILFFTSADVIIPIIKENNIQNINLVVPDPGLPYTSLVLVIPEDSKRKENSVEIIKYLISKPVQENLSLNYGFRSIRTDVEFPNSEITQMQLLNKSYFISPRWFNLKVSELYEQRLSEFNS